MLHIFVLGEENKKCVAFNNFQFAFDPYLLLSYS